MSRRYEGATSRGRRDYSRSSSSEYYRRSLGKSRTRRRDLSPFSDSERFTSSRRRRERDGRRPRSAHVRRYSLDDSDAVYHDRRRRSSFDDDRRDGSRRHERRSGRRSGREKALKNDIKCIFELFAEVVEMVNSERRIIDKITGHRMRSSNRLPKLRLDEDKSAYMMLHKLFDDASLITNVVNDRSRRNFFLELEGESDQSPRHDRSKYRSGRGSRNRYGSDREYGRRSDRGHRDRGYDDDDRDYDRHRSHRNHRSRRR